MALQIILCMETNKQAATDYIYIKDTIDRFYTYNNKTKISRVFMNTKTRYDCKDVKKEIKELTKNYRFGKTKVIYFVDTDDYEKDISHTRDLEIIERYCVENEYDFVWFCHEIEEIYIGKRIPDKQKTAVASSFRRKQMIDSILEKTLMSKEKIKGTSNILCVLDKYLVRKRSKN